jgi:hypothetical protein
MKRTCKNMVLTYSVDNRVITVIQTQTISEAAPYHMTDAETHFPNSKKLETHEDYADIDGIRPVKVCIDRIWTNSNHRKNGYATTLLEVVRKIDAGSEALDRNMMAVSCPTQMGLHFFKRYFELAFQDPMDKEHKVEFLVNPSDVNHHVLNGLLLEEPFSWGEKGDA